jgi:hypothetical protein
LVILKTSDSLKNFEKTMKNLLKPNSIHVNINNNPWEQYRCQPSGDLKELACTTLAKGIDQFNKEYGADTAVLHPTESILAYNTTFSNFNLKHRTKSLLPKDYFQEKSK